MPQEEEILGKAYDSRLMRRLIKYLNPYKWQVVVAIVLAIVTAALGPLRPYLTQVIIDKHIVTGNMNGMWLLIWILVASMILQALAQYALAYLTQWIGQRTIYAIRTQLFQHLQKLALRFFDKNPVGRLVTRLTNDVEVLNDMFSSGVVMIFADLFIIASIIAYMLYISWDLALVTFSCLPLLVLATAIFRKKVRAVYREVRLQVARMNAFMNEDVTGMNTVQLFHQEDRMFSQFKNINRSYTDANVKSIFYYAVFYPGVELISALA
ncbi:MAG TPA: ABC transporter ATP-binding protein, partial [Candidatus Kapabacteria bacterium]|nr:ABC transporter ATP-binding protein [Candidatus Kapabacteria bacterium]